MDLLIVDPSGHEVARLAADRSGLRVLEGALSVPLPEQVPVLTTSSRRVLGGGSMRVTREHLVGPDDAGFPLAAARWLLRQPELAGLHVLPVLPEVGR